MGKYTTCLGTSNRDIVTQCQTQSLSRMSKRHDGLPKHAGGNCEDDSVLDHGEDTATFSIHQSLVNGKWFTEYFLKTFADVTPSHVDIFFSYKLRQNPGPPIENPLAVLPPESPRAFLHSFWRGFKKNLREVCLDRVSDQGRFAHTAIHCIDDSFVSAKKIPYALGFREFPWPCV